MVQEWEREVKTMILQPRDRAIFLLCYQHQFLLTEHTVHFFENQSYREARRRIRELIEAGFLFEEHDSILGRKPLLRLSPIGIKIAADSAANLIPPRRTLKKAELVHDSIVTSARIRFESIWSDARFTPERAIKRDQYAQIPDGIFYFPSGKGVAMEVENSDKGRSRFLRLLGRWSDVREIILILYVATSKTLYDSLKKYLSHTLAPKGQPVGLVIWDDLKEGTPLVWTPRGELPLLERRGF